MIEEEKQSEGVSETPQQPTTSETPPKAKRSRGRAKAKRVAKSGQREAAAVQKVKVARPQRRKTTARRHSQKGLEQPKAKARRAGRRERPSEHLNGGAPTTAVMERSTRGAKTKRRARSIVGFEFHEIASQWLRKQGVMTTPGFVGVLGDLLQKIDVRARTSEHEQLRGLHLRDLQARFEKLASLSRSYSL